MKQLDVLAQHRDALLLAEAIGWLHDYRKCSDEHLQTHAANPSGQQALPRDSLASQHPHLASVKLQLPVQEDARPLTDLLNDKTWDEDLFGQYLSRCHDTAHFDKQEPVGGAQNYPSTKISSPFGFERDVGGFERDVGGFERDVGGFKRDVGGNLTNRLWGLPWNALNGYTSSQRQTLQQAVSGLFSQTVADTRRPINEVDLWSWGLLVGALYKSALAGALLTESKPEARDLRWRLLGIRVNGLNYMLNVARIPDLLARQELLADALNRVRDLLEVTYPLGSEVYRDENGSIFVVPDVADLLARTDNSGKSLRDLILQAFAQGTVKDRSDLQLGGELTPHIELEDPPWWGQDPNWPNSSNDKVPNISSLLTQRIASTASVAAIEQAWQNREATDICTVCGLRPQGPSPKAAERNVCDICEERRADRSQRWATSEADRSQRRATSEADRSQRWATSEADRSQRCATPEADPTIWTDEVADANAPSPPSGESPPTEPTIWTDEVADVNGRLALIVGQFDLTHWLDGSLLGSLLLIAPCDPQKHTSGKPVTSKTPSFSRLRRIWETTRAFWCEVQTESLKQLRDDRRRLKIYLNAKPDLSPFHVYDLAVGPTDLSVVWVPPQNNNNGYLLTTDNLGYIARQLGAESGIYTSPATAAIFVEDYLREQFVTNARQAILRNPDAGTSQRRVNLIAGISFTNIDYQENRYATAIPILAEPRSFMMLVPADKSLEVLKLIKAKYEQEMGKVRDRLPLHLGCVYAHRRTPIRAVLDAGRAMLERHIHPQQWLVRRGDAGCLELERDGYSIQWQIPLKMGDGATDDRWYLYLFLDTAGDDSKADASNRRAVKVSRPIGNGQKVECWIVHAADLRAGETVYLWPSTFDFEFLDTTARRFDIYYDEHGRRPRHTRPFYLEDLDRLEKLWEYMKRLSKTQRHQVIRTIEATRETWYGQDLDGKSTTDEVFRQFVADTLAGAAWPQGQSWASIAEEWREKLVQAGVRGELVDLAELHIEILKE